MTRLADAALFLLGMYLSIRLIAACYRVVDLWYTIRTAYPSVLRGIPGWAGGTLAVAALLGDRHRPALVWGLAAYVLFCLGLRQILKLYLMRKATGRE